MRSDYTDITFILDRSGSMEDMKPEIVKGFKAYIEDQKKLPGKCLVSLRQFDHEHNEVYTALPLDKVEDLFLDPRGATALWDAVGMAIRETGSRLDKLDESEKPAHVLMIILTDGQENASSEFKATQVRLMVEHQEKVYNWTFVYMGAAMSTFGDAKTISMANASMYSHGTYMAANAGLSIATQSLRSGTGFTGMKKDYTHDTEEEAPQTSSQTFPLVTPPPVPRSVKVKTK